MILIDSISSSAYSAMPLSSFAVRFFRSSVRLTILTPLVGLGTLCRRYWAFYMLGTFGGSFLSTGGAWTSIFLICLFGGLMDAFGGSFGAFCRFFRAILRALRCHWDIWFWGGFGSFSRGYKPRIFAAASFDRCEYIRYLRL